MLEKDTVYGGIEKLKTTIDEAYRRFNPKVIFVTTSCASEIIGDDVESAINMGTTPIGNFYTGIIDEKLDSNVSFIINGVLTAMLILMMFILTKRKDSNIK